MIEKNQQKPMSNQEKSQQLTKAKKKKKKHKHQRKSDTEETVTSQETRK